MRDTQRESERQRHRQREKQAPCREPDLGLDPGSPGSHPGLKTALNRLATRAAPRLSLIMPTGAHDQKSMGVSMRLAAVSPTRCGCPEGRGQICLDQQPVHGLPAHKSLFNAGLIAAHMGVEGKFRPRSRGGECFVGGLLGRGQKGREDLMKMS